MKPRKKLFLFDGMSTQLYAENIQRKDFTIALQAIRPEGILDYKILISLPNGLVKEYFLSYDGKNGNPNIEYVSN